MTDRELLELSSKAAGVEYQRTDDGEVIEYFGGGLQLTFNRGKWNPLTNDGDALRLAVSLMEFEPYKSRGFLPCISNDAAATRRAIVRSAAEIGKAMP